MITVRILMSANIFTRFCVHAVCFFAVIASIHSTCTHRFTGLSGQINSPNHPENYSNSTECHYLIHVPRGHTIILHFIHFDLEPEYRTACRFDFFQVFDGPGPQSNSTSLGKFCGSDLPAPVRSTSNILSIKFVTDDSDHYAGFRANYTTKRVRCSHKFTGLSGEFESPNYANNYPDSLNCSYLVQAPFGYIITLSFLHFDLEPRYKDFCKFDFLEVFDGAQSNSTSLGKFCGSRAPAPVHSTSNSLLVMFVTDLSEHYTGFRVSYGTKKVHCRYNFTHLSGQFESPNFPHNYPDSIECYYYLIQVPFDFTITLAFSHFDLEPKYRGACRFDFIEVFDGPWPNSTLLGRFCGADLPAPVNSTFNSLLVKFVTDDSEQRTGFRINYTTSRVCNFMYTEPNGTFWAYYAHRHRHLKECNYYIRAPLGYTITLHFRYIHLLTPYKECNTHTYLEVFTGVQSNSTSLGRFCGSYAPAPVYSTSNSLLVKFVRPRFSSDKDGPYFLAKYTTQKESDSQSQCGNVSTLISSQECFTKVLGGKDAGRRDFPWQVFIEGKGFICGGSLVDKDWVLTAAHCVHDGNKPLPKRNYKIYLGLHRRNRKENRHVQTRTITKIVAHKSFKYETLDNDLALVELDAQAEINNYVNLVCLPNGDRHSRMMTSQGTHGMVAGWGLNERLHETSVLKKVCVPVVRNSTCQQKTPFPFSSNMFCAGTGSKDSCRGDSGGGFAVYDRQQKAWFLGGIVSWGTSSACVKQNYGIYVRVDRYVDWIKKVVYSP